MAVSKHKRGDTFDRSGVINVTQNGLAVADLTGWTAISQMRGARAALIVQFEFQWIDATQRSRRPRHNVANAALAMRARARSQVALGKNWGQNTSFPQPPSALRNQCSDPGFLLDDVRDTGGRPQLPTGCQHLVGPRLADDRHGERAELGFELRVGQRILERTDRVLHEPIEARASCTTNWRTGRSSARSHNSAEAPDATAAAAKS